MKWYNYLSCFFAGVFLIHVIPHLIHGLSVANIVGALISLVRRLPVVVGGEIFVEKSLGDLAATGWDGCGPARGCHASSVAQRIQCGNEFRMATSGRCGRKDSPCAILTGLTAHTLESFLRNDRSHDEGRRRVSPPQTEQGVQQQSTQKNR